MAIPKATTIKEALKRFEEKTKINCTEATEGRIKEKNQFTMRYYEKSSYNYS